MHLESLRIGHLQVVEPGVVQVDHLAALDADQVVVRRARSGPGQGRLVAAVLVQGVDVAHRADVAERFQVLVDGRQGEVRNALAHRPVEVLRAGMLPRGGQGLEDGQTLARGPEAREYLTVNDSYHYFEKLDDLLTTGPTNTNVMDVHIVLVGARP